MEIVKLGDVLKYEQPTKYIVNSTQYNNDFDTPVLTAGKSFLLGYTDESDGIFMDIPVIIFDDFTTAIKFVDFPFKVKSSAMKILKPNKDIADIRFLFYRLMKIKINSSQHKRYWISKYSQLEIPLPPLPEQKRIATILDEADKIRQLNKKLIKKYDSLAQSLFLDMFGDPVTNPKGWEKVTVSDVCSKIFGGGTPSKSKPEFYIGDIPWVTPKDMKLEYIFDSIDHINVEAVKNSSAKLIPKNSVLMVIRSGILKSKLPVAINIKEVTVNQDMKAYIPNNKTNSIFLLHFFKNVQGFLLSKVRAVTADNIEFRQIKELGFILPPIAQQNEFASSIEEIEKQKAQAEESLEKAYDLFNALLQIAFKGNL